jgi:peptide/nickel transport system substrate-binding protein
MQLFRSRSTGFGTQRLSRRRLLAASGAGFALTAACGGRQGSTAAPKASQVKQARAGGKFNQAVKDDPPSFDPSTRFNITGQVLGFTSDRLLSWKTGRDVKYTDFVLMPGIADKWETPDAQNYTFHLHPGVKFANLPPVNGRDCTSADVKWTLEYLSRTGAGSALKPAPSAAMFEGLQSIETPDPATVVVRFKEPFAPFLNNIASEFSGMLAHEVADLEGGYDKHTIGTGPWQLDTSSSQAGQHWNFKRNPTYFRSGRPYIDQITQLILPDDSTANAAFQTKQADLLDYTGLTAPLTQQLQKAVPSSVVYSYLGPEGKHIYMNLSKPPLNDERVRRAFSLSIDRDAMIRALADGHGEWAISGGMPGLFTAEELQKLLPHDPAQAKQLMAAAGYANGVELTVIYPGQKYGQELVNQWQLMQQQLKPAGINLILQSIDATEESNRKRSGDFQLEMSPKVLEGDLDEVVYTMFYSKSAGNYGRIKDAKLDDFVQAQRREPDAAKRRDIWRQTAQYVAQSAYCTDLYYTTRYEVWQSYVTDFYPNQGYRGWPLVNSWLDK